MHEKIQPAGLEKDNNNEQVKIETKTLSRDDFSDLLYGSDGVEIADRRFQREGSFKYFEPNDLTDIANRESYFSTASFEGKIVGVCKLQKIPGRERSYWISFVSIDTEYQKKGYSRKLLEEVFQFAKNNGFTLVASSYSDDGYVTVKRILKDLSRETGVSFEDTEKRF